MHIVCCIKQVPDTTQVKIDPETNTLMRAGVESICNPYDLVAVEAGVRLVEKHGGNVTVISMGPPQTESALRDCLAIGARDAILLSDRAFAGSDTLATSYCLSLAIRKISEAEPVQLVLCGKQAIDGDTAQTGPGVATRLGFNQLTYVSEIRSLDLEKNTITVRREVEGGGEVIESPLPSLLTFELEFGEPRYASLPEMIRSVRQQITIWGAMDIGGEPGRLGLKGSPTTVKEIFSPQIKRGGAVFGNASDPAVIGNFLDALLQKEGWLRPQMEAGG